MLGRVPIGAYLAFLGAVAAMVGPFRPWAHVTVIRNAAVGSSIRLDPSGWNGDGNVVFGLGVAALIVGVLLTQQDLGKRGTALRTALLLCGLLIVAITFWDTTHVSQRFSHVAQRVAEEQRLSRVAPRVRTRVAYGIVIAAIGGVLMLFAAGIDRFVANEQVIIEEDD